MSDVVAAIGLGANLGDRDATLRAAVAALDATPGITVEAVSDFIETAPVGPVAQGAYRNGAARVRTTLSPRALLERCLSIEADHGRDRSGEARWGPRTLDLDLLLYGDRIIDEPGLRVPHPRLAERSFVLEPLAAIGGDLRHPGLDRSVESLLVALAEEARPE